MPMVNEFDIAIVGMACRFPGARNVAEFWHNLAAGVESITRLSDQEILASGVPASYLNDPSYVKAAPVLDEPGGFDAPFFGFSPMEARTMDPQHRILLELAQEAFEAAGCDPDRYQGRVGVFTGSAMNTYFMSNGVSRQFARDYIPTLIFNDKDFLSTRLSYKLNLKGPSITIQTACSTSLVAVHLARQSLLSGETDLTLAGAISVRVPHRAGYFADVGGVTSPDGRVRAFDAKANGTVFGSGGGIVVLKRLTDAIAANDTIHAVIKGSAVNNDGSEKAGYTAPSVNSQADVVVEGLANAGIDADSISYVEAHGSGTPVGDPIEIMALTKAFRASTGRSGYCAVGSVKTNIGHLDVAAGIAGLIKTVLALEHRELPASLHYSEPNPEIDFASTPFYVNARHAQWTGSHPRRAGIMSTGMGGTNAHVVIEEAPEVTRGADAGGPNLLIFSAMTESALDAATAQMQAFLDAHASVNMDDVAHTLQSGRRNFPHRRLLVCAGRDDAIAGLAANSKRLATARVEEGRRPLVLLLPGVGDHYVGMAHDLYETLEGFRHEVDQCARILEPYLGRDIRKILYPDNLNWKNRGASRGIDLKKMLAGRTADAEDADSKRLNETLHVQPALFTIEYALARAWIEAGVVPDAIVGHSMGEYVAACVAGVLSLDDALRLIVRRTQLVSRLRGGRMLAITLSEQEILPLLTPGLSISLINGPALCVVAGSAGEVQEFETMLSGKGVICRAVQNTHAFHSRMLDPIVKAYEDEVRAVRLNAPNIPFMSNVTGTWMTKSDAMDPAYWARHANHTARFSDALSTLWKFSNPILLEAGPGKTLGVLAMQHPDRKNGGHPTVLSSLRHHYENQNDAAVLLQGAGGLWLSGVGIKWDALRQSTPRRKIPLPTYPFERKRYWIENEATQLTLERPFNRADPEHRSFDNWFYIPTWERTLFPADTNPEPPEAGGSWLVFTDRWGGGTGFRSKLEESGATVHVVRFGAAFRRRDDGTFEINPAGLDDYLKVFREIKDTLGGSLNVVHLGCLTADNGSTDYADRYRNRDFGFCSLLYIAQAIGELGVAIPIRIGVISNRIHEVTGEEKLDPEMAPALGLCGVIPREFSNIACFNVDLPGPRQTADPPAGIMTRILAEFTNPHPEGVIAYRGKHRWQRKYAPVTLPVPGILQGSADTPVTNRLRERGVYLITGGTGGLGLAFARYLATTCRARIVLTKKTAFPEKSKWQDLLNSGDAPESVVKTIREILEIERVGAEVDVFVADVADREHMRRVVDATLSRFQTINGVFHAAGIVRPGLIQLKTKEIVDSVLSPKVEGTRVLFDLLGTIRPDFVVLFSSLSAVTVPYAHSDYSAANCFLDAFAHFSNSGSSFHTLSINWPVWKEVGIVAQLESLLGAEALKEQALEKAILTRDGLDAFSRALNSDLQQIIVSPEDLTDLLRQTGQVRDYEKTIRGNGNSGKSVPPDNGQSVLVDRPTNDTETAVARIWTDVFGHEHIGIHQQFAALGGHSLLAMQIVAKVRHEYQTDLTLREFFAAPTIAQLSAKIIERITREIESLSDDEAQQLVQTLKDDGNP